MLKCYSTSTANTNDTLLSAQWSFGRNNMMTARNIYKLALPIAKKAAKRFNANAAELVQYAVAICKVESNFRPQAKNNHSTARGLMQLLICTQREVEKKHIKTKYAPASYSCRSIPAEVVAAADDKMYDPAYNLTVGIHYLAYQFKRYGSWKKAVHAYNQGSYRSGNAAGQKYLAKVLTAMAQMNSMTNDFSQSGQTKFKMDIY